MAKMPKRKLKKRSTEPVEMPQMPFKDALARLLNAPPQHKTKKRNKRG